MRTRLSIIVQQILVTVATVTLLFGGYTAWAAPAALSSLPAIIPYQGTLTTAAGQPVNSSTNLTFKLYTAPTGGTALWTEAHSAVPVSNGLFNVRLGSRNAIPATVWDNSSLYLGLTVGSEAEMSPREQLGAVPAAIRADTALSALAVADGSVKSRGLNLGSGAACLSSNVTVSTPAGGQGVDVPGLALNFTLDKPSKVLIWIDGLTWIHGASGSDRGFYLALDGSAKTASIGKDDFWINIKGQRLLNLNSGTHSLSAAGYSFAGGTMEVHSVGPHQTCINYLVLGE